MEPSVAPTNVRNKKKKLVLDFRWHWDINTLLNKLLPFSLKKIYYQNLYVQADWTHTMGNSSIVQLN